MGALVTKFAIWRSHFLSKFVLFLLDNPLKAIGGIFYMTGSVFIIVPSWDAYWKNRRLSTLGYYDENSPNYKKKEIFWAVDHSKDIEEVDPRL